MSGGFGDILKGAAGGGMAGSAFGPVGTGLGILGGGIAGWMGGGQPDTSGGANQQWGDYFNQVMSRSNNPYQMGPAAQAGDSSFRNNQQNLVKMLEQQASGQGPSQAGLMLQKAQEGNANSQMAMANSGRGNATLGMQGAQANTARLGAQSGQDAAIARMQEIYNAQNQLGGVLQGARGQDQNLSMFNTGQQNQQSQANLEARLRQMGMNDQAIQQILGARTQIGENNYNQPTLGSQLLAGGAGALAFANSQKANNQGGNGQSSMIPWMDNNPSLGQMQSDGLVNPWA